MLLLIVIIIEARFLFQWLSVTIQRFNDILLPTNETAMSSKRWIVIRKPLEKKPAFNYYYYYYYVHF